ncbi:MAG: hypothetical protein LBD11_01520 [Candidatus Peribacteria bacterium]|jgi:protein-S-isoprenylcysteine O-methyltransferase Ste14|nr:hypothetical protein [Candidatus Peribacteria bacterium]
MKIKKFFSEKSISNSIIPGGILVVILVCFGFMFVGLSDVSRDPSLAQVGNVMLGCAGIIAVAIWLVCTVFLCLGFLWDKDGHSALVNGKC